MIDEKRVQVADLKGELEREIDSTTDFDVLMPKDIDRSIQSDHWSLSTKELNGLIGGYLTLLNETTDVAPKIDSISSHRGFIGAPVVAIKKLLFTLLRPFTDTLLADQKTFNGQVVQIQLAQFVLQTRLQEEMSATIRRIRSLEEDSAVLMERIQRLQPTK